MYSKIDWYSFSFYVQPSRSADYFDNLNNIYSHLNELSPALTDMLALEDGIERAGGRKPYSMGFKAVGSGAMCFFHPDLTHSVIELSGETCDTLRMAGTFDGIVSATFNHCTRIDVASDILTQSDPETFSKHREGARFKAHAVISSETGKTCYVGSFKSDRYARVYRYNPPHPRAEFMRVEHVFRSDYAKSVAHAISTRGLASVVSACGDTYGWQSPLWQPEEALPAEISAPRQDRENARTIAWLWKTVYPLLARLEAEGVINVTQDLLNFKNKVE